MNITIEHLQEFLQKYNINWSGYYCTTQNTHIFNKADSFNDLTSSKWEPSFVRLYFGHPEETVAGVIRADDEASIHSFYIGDTTFQLLEKSNNEENYVIKKDLSREWIKFLLEKVPNYKNEVLEKCNNRYLEISNTLYASITEIESQIAMLNEQKTLAHKEALKSKEQVNIIKTLVCALDNENLK